MPCEVFTSTDTSFVANWDETLRNRQALIIVQVGHVSTDAEPPIHTLKIGKGIVYPASTGGSLQELSAYTHVDNELDKSLKDFQKCFKDGLNASKDVDAAEESAMNKIKDVFESELQAHSATRILITDQATATIFKDKSTEHGLFYPLDPSHIDQDSQADPPM